MGASSLACLARAVVPLALFCAILVVFAPGCDLALDIPERTASPGYACEEGPCVCVNSLGDCDGELDNGCEAHLDSDSEHCGQCGRSCLGGSCEEGRCQPQGLIALGELGVEGSMASTTHPFAAGLHVHGDLLYWSSSGTAFGSFTEIKSASQAGIYRTPVDLLDAALGEPVLAGTLGGFFSASAERLYVSSGSKIPGFIGVFEEGEPTASLLYEAPAMDPGAEVRVLVFGKGALYALNVRDRRHALIELAGDRARRATWTVGGSLTAIAHDGEALYLARTEPSTGGEVRYVVSRATDPLASLGEDIFSGVGVVAGVIPTADAIYVACVECAGDASQGLVKRDGIMRWRAGLSEPELLSSTKDVGGFVVDEHHAYWVERLGSVMAQPLEGGEAVVLYSSSVGGMVGLAQDSHVLYFRDSNAVYRLAKPMP